MGRVALAAGGIVVALLVGVLLVQSRSRVDDPVDGQPTAATPADPAHTGAGRPIEGQQARALPPQPAGDEDQESPLPTAAEQAAARERVAAERVRPGHLSPDLVMDHKLKVKPLRDARKAYQRGEYELALSRAQDALAVEPDSNAARVLATLAACALNRPAVAQAHADKLDGMRKARVTGRCEEFGVAIDAGRRAAGKSDEGPPPASTD